MKFKGEIEVKSSFVGDWLVLHKDGEHIKDFEFEGLVIGYELEVVHQDDKDKDVVYLADKNGKIWKTSTGQIYGPIKLALKTQSIHYGDIVVIRYTGKKKITDAHGVRYLNTYDIKFYSAKANPDFATPILEKIKDQVPPEQRARWIHTYNELANVDVSDKPPF